VNALHSVLTWLCDGYWPTDEPNDDLLVRAQDVRSPYTPVQLLASGEVADLYLATGTEGPWSDAVIPYLLKVARNPDGNAHLHNERKVLTRLRGAAGHTTYQKYLPHLVDSFIAAGPFQRRINAYPFEPGFFTLEQVHEQHPALDGRHLAWIFKRLLTVLGFCHQQHTIHGAIVPSHVLIHAASHGLQLVGWGRSVAPGQRLRSVPVPYRDWYPPELHDMRPADLTTDLFLAARCLVYLAGGDPVTNWMPDTVPLPMQQFVGTCLLESARMRPDDAWSLLEDFDDLLQGLYGPPRFWKLTLS